MLGAQVDCLLAGWPSASPPLFFAESTLRRTLKIFVIPADKPAGPPEPGPEIELEAPTEDALLTAAHEAIGKRGQRARAVSFTPTGLLAYAEAGR